MIKQNENKNVVIKQETEHVGAISIARRAQRKCLKHNSNGITLVALVITIIVLLILAGVTINLTLGERGIFRTAEKAAKNYQDSQQEEMYGLNSLENEINNTIDNLGNLENSENLGSSGSSSTEVQTIPVTNIEITPNSATIKPKETVQLTAEVSPDNATNKDVTWNSSNTAVATVEQSGVVTGVSSGTTTITATSSNGKDETEIVGECTITVKNDKVYLYKQGNKCENITGGWVIDAGTGASSAGEVRWNSTSLYLKGSSSTNCGEYGVRTINKIDYSKYTKVYIRVIECTNGHYGVGRNCTELVLLVVIGLLVPM